ncbi:hypothetical protein ALP37_05481 [Pseudomonas amygdali pv. sesami]|nr:Uncharacterized protein ALO93_05525 [Pseudomonas amygdali pv. sesami]RMT98949.1 hypothetical protein ALP37_05481 [Pseudomonas amygdali pv. sesami]
MRHALLSSGRAQLLEPVGSGGHDQLAGTIIVNAVDVEQVIYRLLGQVFAGNYAAHRQFHRQILVHTLKREQVFGRMGVCQLFLCSDGFSQQTILGTSAKLVDDFFVKAVDVEHFFQRYVGNLFQAGEAFINQHLCQFFIDFEFFDEIAQDVTGFSLLLGLDVRFGHYVQGPASQLTCQTHVLTATTNSLGQVVRSHCDVHCMRVFIYDDCRYFCRRHCIDHELRRVIVPKNDIHTLATQLAGNSLNSRTAHADTGTLRIDSFILGANSDFRTRTRVTGGSHHLDETLGNFRHFNAEKLDQHFWRSTRQDQLRTTVFGTNFLQQSTDANTDPESFPGNDVFTSQQGFGIVTQVNDDIVTCNLFNSTRNDFTQTLTVGIDYLSTLGFTNFLHNDLLGGLCGDTTEFDGIDFFFDQVARNGTWLLDLSLVYGQFVRRIVQIFVFDNCPATESLVVACLAIDLYTQFYFIFKTFLGSGGKSQLQRFKNYTCRNALFIGHRLNNQQYFFAHRTPRLSQAIGSAGSAVTGTSQSNVGIMLALSIMSIGNRNSWSSTCTTTSCSSTPRRRP